LKQDRFRPALRTDILKIVVIMVILVKMGCKKDWNFEIKTGLVY
jgi:hypothetical protein